MATVYIHIGTPKTGTTALQSLLATNEPALNKQGYSYPNLSEGLKYVFRDRNGHFLSYSETSEQPYNIEGEGTLRERCMAAIEERSKKYPNIILSDEVLWYRCNMIPKYWERLLGDFKKINCQVKMIVYLRRQDEMIQSIWNQTVKANSDFSKTFKEAIETNHFKFYPMDYYKHLNKIASYIGKENLIVRVYEKGQFGGSENNLISDFLESIGLEYTDDFDLSKIPTNYGLNGNFVEMKRMINQIPQYQEMSNYMSFPMIYASVFGESLEEIPKTSLFTYEDQVKYMAQFEESNAMVAKEYLGREDGILYRVPVKKLPLFEVNQDHMSRDVLIYAAEMFCYQQKRIEALQTEVQNMKDELRDLHNSKLYKAYQKVRETLKK